MYQRHLAKTLLAFGLVTTAALATRDASASFIDIGVQGGVSSRTLADVRYKPAFNFQAHADLALIPPILMVGAYIGGIPIGGQAYPAAGQGVGTEDSVTFRTFGLRAKLKIPLPGPVTPYGIAGVGLVNASFPDVTITKCATVAGQSGCIGQTVPNANKYFAEFVLGVGMMIKLAGPLFLTLEGAWRPTTGYKNEDYDKALETQKQPAPSRTGSSWTFHGGLAISF